MLVCNGALKMLSALGLSRFFLPGAATAETLPNNAQLGQEKPHFVRVLENLLL